ncbi:MAG: hypothetical protein JWO91_1160 [Acidobacteriaceae bacterium]|jgi:hypothetical protein|nr:hypothetical protein [Acidobacteriaceae bacterium]
MLMANKNAGGINTPAKLRVPRFLFFALLGVVFLTAQLATADARPLSTGPLDEGFHLLYSLDFNRAHQVFLAYEGGHPDDPLAPACDAAGLLFSEFNRLGVLEAQFYDDDKSFENRKKQNADPAVRERFNAAIQLSESRAHAKLAKNPKDPDALFALTLSSGLQADYAALIEKSNLTSLHFTKVATGWADQLLAVDPKCYDAHVATGFSKYIIGSMSAPVRWLVRLGGVSGDKKAGISELQLTADHGRYLAPFARILLAIAYVREKDRPRAREILASLRDEFPSNPLFAKEIARLDTRR